MSLFVKIKKKMGNFTLDVCFETGEGVFALLGASGCGKSMTLKCIAGIETPDEGRIVLNDRVLFDSKQKVNLIPQKRKVGYLFQDYALFPNMTVEENIRIGMEKKSNKEKNDAGLVEQYVEKFQLKGLENHYPDQLSGGQKQRVAMIRLLAGEPEVILLDEPFSALDSFLRWEIEEETRQLLSNMDKPAVFVSHNRDEVYRLCSDVGCMNHGKLEVTDTVKGLFQNPKTKTAAVLSGCKNISDAEWTGQSKLYLTAWDKIIDFPYSEIGAIGIRAHMFQPVFDSKKKPALGMYVFYVTEYRIVEDPFEWILFFRENEKSDWLQWKTGKKEWDGKTIPKAFCIKKEDILCLKC